MLSLFKISLMRDASVAQWVSIQLLVLALRGPGMQPYVGLHAQPGGYLRILSLSLSLCPFPCSRFLSLQNINKQISLMHSE